MPARNWTNIGLWVLSGLLALLFLIAGGSKLAGVPEMQHNFQNWGYPQWFRVVVGGSEVISAVVILVPRAAWGGATVLAVLMAGATLTHVFLEDGGFGKAAFTAVLMLLAATVAYGRRPDALRTEGT